MPDILSVYLATDDMDETLKGTVAHGGQVHVPAMAVGDLGVMALIADAGDAAAVGVWPPGRHQGFGVLGEPGAPNWFELFARHYIETVRCLDVFGCQTQVLSDTDEFRHTTLKRGEDWLAGVMDEADTLPAGDPPHWALYFGVDDAEAAWDSTVDMGGSILRPGEITPYRRIARAADPMGARFMFVAANAAMPARD